MTIRLIDTGYSSDTHFRYKLQIKKFYFLWITINRFDFLTSALDGFTNTTQSQILCIK